MWSDDGARSGTDDAFVDLVARRVADMLRVDLQAIADWRPMSAAEAQALTVGQVADRLGVARSTVYAHWREWGGYKLGRGRKAPIRFDAAALPAGAAETNGSHAPAAELPPRRRPPQRRRRRRDLVSDEPRLSQTIDTLT